MVKKDLDMLPSGSVDFTRFIRVLAALCREPSREFYLEELPNYLEELPESTGLSKPTIAKELAAIMHEGLATSRQVGRTVLYKVDLDNPLVRQYRVLLNVELLYGVFKDFEGSEVYLFGSYSRGDEKEDSDIDLLFVGNAPRDQVRKACDKVEESIGKRVSQVVYSKQEFSMLAQNEKNRAFFENLIRNSIKVNRWT